MRTITSINIPLDMNNQVIELTPPSGSTLLTVHHDEESSCIDAYFIGEQTIDTVEIHELYITRSGAQVPDGFNYLCTIGTDGYIDHVFHKGPTG
jgi:hypothetical protein